MGDFMREKERLCICKWTCIYLFMSQKATPFQIQKCILCNNNIVKLIVDLLPQSAVINRRWVCVFWVSKQRIEREPLSVYLDCVSVSKYRERKRKRERERERERAYDGFSQNKIASDFQKSYKNAFKVPFSSNLHQIFGLKFCPLKNLNRCFQVCTVSLEQCDLF